MSRRYLGHGSVAGNVPAFYVYAFLTNLQLWMSLWVVYLTQYRGLSLTQVNIMEAVFTLIVVASQMPSGAFADRWGMRATFAAGGALMTLVCLPLFLLWWRADQSARGGTRVFGHSRGGTSR